MGRQSSADVQDPLLSSSSPLSHWTTANVGEALPGVMTPLGWTLFGYVSDHCLRETFYAIGAVSRAERVVPADVDERIFRVFYGRPALNVDFLCAMGDRLPGTSAAKVAESVIGALPDGVIASPSRRRHLHVAVRFPLTSIRLPRRAHRAAGRTATWWPTEVRQAAQHDRAAAVAAYRAAAIRLDQHVVDQTTMLFAVVQPIYEALNKIIEKSGTGDIGTLTGGYGGVPESAVVAALWEAAHGQVDLADVIERFGFHGPLEGEISGRVWRDDDTPLRRIMDDYAALGADAHPALREQARRDERVAMEREVIAALPAPLRAAARALFSVASRRIPMRGVLKVAFLQALDVCRANARRIGELAAADGLLDDQEDVWYLTTDEVIEPLPAGLRDLVALRRQRRQEYQAVCLPVSWTGMPQPLSEPAEAARKHTDVVTGIGVSPGIVEGTARVVIDPGFADVEPGEILVARTTDPSWSSIMFISAALVVDIGGALSHAALVARELGIPCVVGTAVGTSALRTGDHVRVDGRAGTVEILRRT